MHLMLSLVVCLIFWTCQQVFFYIYFEAIPSFLTPGNYLLVDLCAYKKVCPFNGATPMIQPNSSDFHFSWNQMPNGIGKWLNFITVLPFYQVEILPGTTVTYFLMHALSEWFGDLFIMSLPVIQCAHSPTFWPSPLTP